MEEHRRDGRMNRADAADGRTASKLIRPSSVYPRPTCTEGFWTLRTPRRVQG